MVPLVLCRNKVPPQEQKAIAGAMVAIKQSSTDVAFKLQGRYGMDFGKLEFPQKTHYKYNFF